MKKLLLFLLLIPGLLFAQENPKYLEGAVPMEDGKVVFRKTLAVPGASREAIFNKANLWAGGRFLPDGEFQSRVLATEPAEGMIACMGQQYLVFTDKALALDRAVVSYQLMLTCTDGQCEMKVFAIRYLYNVGDKRENFPAEEQITDEYTLTKKKDKLIRATGKFRIHTIDMVEGLYGELQQALANVAQPAGTAATGTATKTTATITAQALTPATQTTTTVTGNTTTASIRNTATEQTAGNAPAGYKQITADKIPGNIYKLLSENWMLITAGNDDGFNMMTASWGGLGHMYNKPVAFCFINPTRHTIQYMEKNDTYTLSFYTETYRDALNYCGSHSGKNEDKVQGSGLTPVTMPSGAKAFNEAWMIIECKKMVEQPFAPEALVNPEDKARWGKELHKMFVGEILRVWVK